MLVFIDMISLKQYFPNKKSIVFNSGFTVSSELDNSDLIEIEDKNILVFSSLDKIKYVKTHSRNVKGSYDSSAQIHMENGWLSVTCNPSRLDRLDNFYGLSLDDSIKKINSFLNSLGLPSFTYVNSSEIDFKITPGGSISFSCDNAAVITMIHLTTNFLLDSSASDYHQFLLRHKPFRSSKVKADDINSFARYNFDSIVLAHAKKRYKIKCYDKVLELGEQIKRCKVLKRKLSSKVLSNDDSFRIFKACDTRINYLSAVRNYFLKSDVNISRFEVELWSTFLASDYRYRFLTNSSSDAFSSYFDSLVSKAMDFNPISDVSVADKLTCKEFGVFQKWKQGADLKLKKTTFYRHRASIKK